MEATQDLVRSLNRLDGDLKCVEGLSEVKEVLVNQKETLYNRLLEDLSKQLFTESTWEVLKKIENPTPFQRTSSNQGRAVKDLRNCSLNLTSKFEDFIQKTLKKEP